MPDRSASVSANAEHVRLRTRIKGLDRLLDGGLIAGDAYLVAGGPGTGKTTLGNQLAFQHAAAGESAVIYMLQTEPHEWMLAHLGAFQFVRPELINKRIHYVSLLRQLETEGLPGMLHAIQATLREHNASLIVLDGAGLVDALGESGHGYGRFVRDLQARAAMLNCTCVLLSAQEVQPLLAPAVDGVIELDYRPFDSRDARLIRIAKQRGANHLSGQHQFVIGPSGIEIFPRLEAVARKDPAFWADSDARDSIGVEGIDRMLGGGLIKGSTTAVFGTPGIGKTLLNLQFLGAGAMAGETVLHVTFHETAEILRATSERLGLSFAGLLSSGLLHVNWEPALERSVDGWAWAVLETVDRLQASRVTIDTFTDVARLLALPQRHVSFGVALSNELRNREVTSLVNLELDSFVSQTVDITIPRISPMIDSGILMRSVESGSTIRRAISVTKHRQSWFDSTIRAFTIDRGGIQIED